MRRGRRLVIATVLVALLASCGGDDDNDDGGDDAATSTTQEESTTTSIDEQAATEEITQNWVAFFNNQLPLDERVTYLEDGQELKPFVEQQAQILGEQASQASAQVDNVTLNDDGTATVEFQILLSGQPVLPTTGTAVLVDDKWVVSKTTLCDLIALAGTTPPECADIAAGG
jgi:ABC-type glycerol-3-phosphate transport system substrate-binding protein